MSRGIIGRPSRGDTIFTNYLEIKRSCLIIAYIYKIVNDINQKIYIGKTEFSIEKRWAEHCNDYLKRDSENRPLYRAMKKYGIKNFHIELVEETNNPSEREIYWIEYYNSFKYGYNATLGGDGKRYLDYDLIIKTYNDTHNCNKTAQILNISADSVRNVIKSHGYTPDRRVANFKAVAQLDLKTGEIIKVYSSIKEAERSLNISKHISAVCNGKRKSAGGYGWKYI